MELDFYRAFEDKYRGSRETIKERLHAYAGFIAPLAARCKSAAALDLGCGRGEWLELLADSGFAARGVDLDEGMLAACRERGLQVDNADAVASLRALPDASVALVSAFHLVEHIPFDALQQLVHEALRVLRPGGLLIMETPNPENLVVGASSFYMDPSHLKPIPPRLLSFVAEHAGFARHKVLRLQEEPQLHSNAPIGLINVLEGVSPDYSVVAQKAGDPGLLAMLDPLFARDYGFDLGALAQRFEAQETARRAELHTALGRLDERLGSAEAAHALLAERTEQVAAHLSQQIARQRTDLDALQAALRLARSEAERWRAEQQTALAEAQCAALDARLSEAALQAAQLKEQLVQAEAAGAQAHGECTLAQAALAQAQAELAQARAQCAQVQAELAQAQAERGQAQAQSAELERRVANLLASRSWQITGPLRGLRRLFPRSRQGAPPQRAGRDSRAPRAPLRSLVQTVLRRPRLKSAARRVLQHFPSLRARIHTMMYLQPQPGPQPPLSPDERPELSPRAMRIYRALKDARGPSRT